MAQLRRSADDSVIWFAFLVKCSLYCRGLSLLYQAQFRFVDLMATRFCRDTACRVSTNSQNPIALCIMTVIESDVAVK